MVGFRLDVNEKVATGHMFRCIAIAKKIRELGDDCVFFTAEDSDADAVIQNDFSLVKLPLKWDNWDENISALQDELIARKISILVVDSYYVTKHFFETVSQTLPVFYLDDLCKETYPLRGVLHYSEWEGENTIQKLYEGTDTNVYSGMKYMPLREGFGIKGSHNKYDLLITTGGSDPYKISLKLAEFFVSNKIDNIKKICFVLGKMNQDDSEIKALLQGNSDITVLQNINNMNEVIADSFLAVTAGGTSVYELMAGGTAFTCFSFSDDQVIFGEKLSSHGHCLYAGDAREDADKVVEKIIKNVGEMAGMPEDELTEIIKRNRSVVDGQGAGRIAEVILHNINKN